jgi:hypothetical protein
VAPRVSASTLTARTRGAACRWWWQSRHHSPGQSGSCRDAGNSSSSSSSSVSEGTGNLYGILQPVAAVCLHKLKVTARSTKSPFAHRKENSLTKCSRFASTKNLYSTCIQAFDNVAQAKQHQQHYQICHMCVNHSVQGCGESRGQSQGVNSVSCPHHMQPRPKQRQLALPFSLSKAQGCGLSCSQSTISQLTTRCQVRPTQHQQH